MGRVGGKRGRGGNKVNTVIFICKILKILKKKNSASFLYPHLNIVSILYNYRAMIGLMAWEKVSLGITLIIYLVSWVWP